MYMVLSAAGVLNPVLTGPSRLLGGGPGGLATWTSGSGGRAVPASFSSSTVAAKVGAIMKAELVLLS